MYYQSYYSPYRPPGPGSNTNNHNNHASFVPENDPSVLIARQSSMDNNEQNKLPPITAWNDYRNPYKASQYHTTSPKMAHQQVN